MTIIPALAERYGVRPDQIREVPGGVANQTYTLGDHLFLRIPRSQEFEADLVKEVAVIPVARAAGVRTPAIVDFDDTRSIVDAPYVVMERVHATDLVDSEAEHPELWPELGDQMRLLHETKYQQIKGVPTDEDNDPRPTVERLATDGWIDTGTAKWLLTWFEHLATRFDRAAPNVLLHGDLAAQNIMVDQDGRYCALIDWGDAAWGPAGAEFAKLRLEQVAQLLPGYRQAGHGELEAAALWFHLSWGLSNLLSPNQPNPLGSGRSNPLGSGRSNPLGSGRSNPLGSGRPNPSARVDPTPRLGPVQPLGSGRPNPLGSGRPNPSARAGPTPRLGPTQPPQLGPTQPPQLGPTQPPRLGPVGPPRLGSVGPPWVGAGRGRWSAAGGAAALDCGARESPVRRAAVLCWGPSVAVAGAGRPAAHLLTVIDVVSARKTRVRGLVRTWCRLLFRD
ncbi:aminoglycoside phosphotransferase family protein [Kribbella monticola]|uniref:aminoglycoside phosphotransferase family protein n=1 Tax=Kribbella monticola TaxID=2185285 RepID=UPI0018E4E344|nr:aminoglycoside phosphotransferase family protein [Kribbella monticola]